MNIPRRFIFTMAAAIGLSAPLSLRAADKDKDKESPAAPAPAAAAAAAAADSKIDPEALAILNRAVDKLAAARQFSVSVEIWQEIELEDGLKGQGTKLVDIKVRRPDHALVSVKTTVPKRSFFYDGKNFSLLDLEKNVYGTVPAPATLDETLSKMEDEHGIDLPIDDILVSRPFGDGAAKATEARYLGVEPVLGVTCHHLIFQNDSLTWQAWVEDGPVAVIRKAVISANDPGDGPNITAILTHWDFSTELPDFVFAFDPPDNALKVEFVAEKEAPAPEEEPAKK